METRQGWGDSPRSSAPPRRLYPAAHARKGKIHRDRAIRPVDSPSPSDFPGSRAKGGDLFGWDPIRPGHPGRARRPRRESALTLGRLEGRIAWLLVCSGRKGQVSGGGSRGGPRSRDSQPSCLPRIGTRSPSKVEPPAVGVGSPFRGPVRTAAPLAWSESTLCLAWRAAELFSARSGPNNAGPSKPFTGSAAPDTTAAPAGPRPAPAPRPIASARPCPVPAGCSPGRWSITFNRHPSKVYIQVVDLQDPEAAPLGTPGGQVAGQDGYFVVQGLKPGRHYRLIARVKEGEKVLSGATLAMPPNARLSIYLSEELVGDSPPIPGPPVVPGTRSSSGEGGADLDPPVKTKPGETPAPANDIPPPSNPTGAQIWAPNPGAPVVPSTPAVAPERMAGIRGTTTPEHGITRRPRRRLWCPPASPLPPAPQWNTLPQNPPPAPPPPPAAPAPETQPFGFHLPTVNTPVPSCVVVGQAGQGVRSERSQFRALGIQAPSPRPRGADRLLVQHLRPVPRGHRPSRPLPQLLRPLWVGDNRHCLREKGAARGAGGGRAGGVRARYGINYTTLLAARPDLSGQDPVAGPRLPHARPS